MSLFAFYAWHSFKNQIKKLCRTWVAILLLVCLVIGLVIGLGTALIVSLTEEKDDGVPADSSAQVLPGEETASSAISGTEDAGKDTEDSDGDTDEDFVLTDPATGEVLRVVSGLDLLELIVSAVVLFIFALMILTADKSNIFLPGDTVLLFTAPMKPQKVLLFRLGCSMGVFVIASLYMFGQIPNLMRIPGFTWWTVLALGFVYTMALIQSMILKSMAFIYCTGDAGKKRWLRFGVYGVLILVFGAWVVYSQCFGTKNIWIDGMLFFLKDRIRFIPVLGWLRAVPAYMFEGNYAMALLFAAVNIGFAALLLWLISRMKADFYEPALARSEEYAEMLEKAQRNSVGFAGKTRKKDRSERFVRNELRRGSGADMYFFKEMYNRRRFAMLGLFTKTFGTYLVLGVGLTVILHFAGVHLLLPAAAVMAVIAFYRTLGNPLDADTRLHYFTLIPAKSSAKLFWSILAGICSTAMDVIVPLVICAVIARASVWEVLCSILLILALDFYATCTSTFIDLSLSNNVGKNVKTVVQIMFIYFGILPIAAAVAVGGVLGYLNLGLLGGAAVSVGLGVLFFSFLPKFI